ncbi:phosphonatase-like hydrolase [Pseudonocardia sp. C8]|uniref:phosphonatase-like hydrolase n=1 Tax=Pseudonocardia sp. C8 TaxID=2762759 RepID=UPI0016426B10|nr:phosphonatase-like hydrolase [Pseudonocardia sp. C8]MBC3192444.1 phosphonatase-like hydrolase [Pseudonocardia sp. C8]
MIELAVLDIAGTTVDEGGAVYRVLAEVVTEAGHPPADTELRRWMGADKREALAALTGRAQVEDLHETFVARLAEAYAATPPQPLPGVPAALAALRSAGTSVVLTTGFDRQVTDPLLAALPAAFTGELDAVVCAHDVGAGRPDPAMIHRAMELAHVADPARVLTAGDTVLDVQAGRNAGAGRVVGVLTGAQTREELAVAGPTDVVGGVADLPALLGIPVPA